MCKILKLKCFKKKRARDLLRHEQCWGIQSKLLKAQTEKYGKWHSVKLIRILSSFKYSILKVSKIRGCSLDVCTQLWPWKPWTNWIKTCLSTVFACHENCRSVLYYKWLSALFAACLSVNLKCFFESCQIKFFFKMQVITAFYFSPGENISAAESSV